MSKPKEQAALSQVEERPSKAVFNIKLVKSVIYAIWFCLLLFFVGYYLYDPSILSVERLGGFLQRFEGWVLVVYIFVSFARGAFLLPSTPFILVGAAIFPDYPWLVAVVSMGGILFCATLLYFLADQMGFSDYLEKKYPKQLEAMEKKLNHRRAVFIIIGWSFFPLVPTDLICYVARLVKIRYRIMITGVFIGESVLIALCLYLGRDVLAFG